MTRPLKRGEAEARVVRAAVAYVQSRVRLQRAVLDAQSVMPGEREQLHAAQLQAEMELITAVMPILRSESRTGRAGKGKG